MLEKVYDDFKRLHEHITETFLNEINEYEKHQKIQASGLPADNQIAKRYETQQLGGSMQFDGSEARVTNSQQQFHLRDTRNFGSM